MSKTQSRLMFQCLSGRHAGEILPDTELAEKALASSRLDALILIDDECPSCIERSRENARQMWGMLGCPKHEDKCPSGHDCGPEVIADSPYEGQIGKCFDLDLHGHPDLDEGFGL